MFENRECDSSSRMCMDAIADYTQTGIEIGNKKSDTLTSVGTPAIQREQSQSTVLTDVPFTFHIRFLR